MPIPKPNAQESKDAFISRCMGNDLMNKEYSDKEQRAGVCYTQWKKHGQSGERGGDRGGSKDRPLENLKLDTVNLAGVEVTEAGVYKGIENTESDLDEMIQNFQSGVTDPYITIDHSEKATSQFKDALKAVSLGWVDRLYRNGKKLIADFKQVPRKLAELIEAGALKKKSIEFYKKYIKADGGRYSNVLQGVTFHGANGSPAVTSLSDVLALYKNDVDNHVELSNEIISLKDEEKTKENRVMDKIEITKSEYDELLAHKNKSEGLNNDVTNFKNEVTELKNQIAEKDQVIADFEKKVKDFEAFKNNVEAEKTKAADKEAMDYVDSMIKEGKVIPASKDMYVANYKRCRDEGENSLTLFKQDIESRNNGIFENESADNKTLSSDDVEKLVELKMKQGKTFSDARDEAIKEIGG